MEFIKNTWFVGISTGIISGVLVFFFTNWIMKKKGKEDYFKQVAMANQNVISALKPYIAERGLPEVEMFRALIASTARKYSVKAYDMYTISMFCEELIREIISDVYVSSDKKKEYTDILITYKKDVDKENLQEKTDGTNTVDYSAKLRKRIAGYMSVLTSITTIILTIILQRVENTYPSFNDFLETDPFRLLAAATPIIIIVCVGVWEIIKKD